MTRNRIRGHSSGIGSSSRPASSTKAGSMVPTKSGMVGRIGCHAVPCWIARRIDGALLPPTQIGGCGVCTGRGVVCTSSNDTNSPWKLATSSAHNALIACKYSVVIAPRCSNGTPRMRNSSAAQPEPTPRMHRPRLSWSILANARAVSSGLRYGSTLTVVPIIMSDVFAASHPSIDSGS